MFKTEIKMKNCMKNIILINKNGVEVKVEIITKKRAVIHLRNVFLCNRL